jgi:hypothetical protein
MIGRRLDSAIGVTPFGGDDDSARARRFEDCGERGASEHLSGSTLAFHFVFCVYQIEIAVECSAQSPLWCDPRAIRREPLMR